MICVDPQSNDTSILVLSQKGYGKRSDLADYRVTGRGGKGVKTIQVTDKTGALVGIMDVNNEDGLMIINRSGLSIRMAIESLRVVGRATQGVRLINIKNNDEIAGLAKVPRDDEEEQDADAENLTNNSNEENHE
jgi:DNA gyrase subunit A